VAIEPNEIFRNAMSVKGHIVYDYASSALRGGGGGGKIVNKIK
jgi:hypothetical protein